MDEPLLEFLEAVRHGDPWLERFSRAAYAGAFQEYARTYGHLYRQAIAERGAESLAEELLDALEQGWKRERFWNRSARRFNEKRMIVVYLSPMLLEEGEEAFARCLREAWARRWPKDAYRIAPFQKLNGSFRNTILGFEIGARREEEEF